MTLAETRLPGPRSRLAVLASLLVASAVPAFAESAWLTRAWQTDEGLPNNYVTAIAVGRDGYMWVGTPAGLRQFDGVHFTSISFGPDGNKDQGIQNILPANDGSLWIAPIRGPLTGLNPELSRISITNSNLPEGTPVAAIEDRAGSLWIAYSRVVCRIKEQQVTQFSPNEGMPTGARFGGLARDSDGNVWLAKGDAAGFFLNGRFQSRARYSRVRLAAARTNGVWLATGTHLFKYATNGSIQDFGTFQPDTPRAESWAVMEDHSGAVWIGTDGSGLFRRGESGFEKIETSHPYILSLAEDHEGNVWVGTAGGGLDRISPKGVQLEGVTGDSSLVAVQSICEDTNGVLWGATQDGRLVFRSDGKWIPKFTSAQMPEVVTCVAADHSGSVWIGTRDVKLFRWRNGELTAWDTKKGFVGHTVVALLPASNGDLWLGVIGTPNTLLRLRDEHLLNIPPPRTAGRVTALAEDSAGHIWVASANGALSRVEGDQLHDESSQLQSAGRGILCLFPTPDGALWIGYDGSGLARLQDGHFTRMGSAQGLFDDHISQIVSDQEGWFWFGCSRGIFKIPQRELEEVLAARARYVRSVHYGRNEGLFSEQANSVNVAPFVSPNAFRSRDDRLWIPLRRTIAVVDPKILRETPAPPPVMITRVAVDNQTIAACGNFDDSSIANLKSRSGPLPLSPYHRKLEFEFTALNFRAPENVRFNLRLEGLDDDWVETEMRNAVYSRLPSGKYRFRVRACVGDGPWQEAEAPVAIIVAPFLWQTWWFRLSMVAAFTLAVIATVRYVSFRRLHLKLRALEQQAVLEKERTRIARDLHDDLGCSLTQVALTLDMAQRNGTAPEQANGQFQRCSSMVRQVARSVDEIVWAINPRNDTLRYVIDYLSHFAVEFLHAADIGCRVNFPDNLPSRPVSPEARHHLFLVVKEALNNITRHAQASEVRLDITATEEQIAIVIADNGRGFDAAPDDSRADGLRNMRQRMAEIGGQLKIETRPAAGTAVSLVYPLPANKP